MKEYWEKRAEFHRMEADKLKQERNNTHNPDVKADILKRLEYSLTEFNVAKEALEKFS